MSIRSKALLLFVLTLAAAGPAWSAPVYNMRALSPGAQYSASVNDLNASGIVVGQWRNEAFYNDGEPHGFVLPATASNASGINDAGLVVGAIFTGSGAGGFYYDVQYHDIGTLGGTSTGANDVNNFGQIVGSSTLANGMARAYLYDGQMHNLGTLGGETSNAVDVNDVGQVVGSSTTSSFTQPHAFLWTPDVVRGTTGAMVDLGTMGGAASQAEAINSSGHVAGTFVASSGGPNQHGFWYDGSTMHDIGNLGADFTYVSDIDSVDHIVGKSGINHLGFQHAFLYTPGSGMVDLNTLIDPQSGYILEDAVAINEAGQIAAIGRESFSSNIYESFLLTPIPEPSSVAIAAALVVGLGTENRRRRPLRRRASADQRVESD